MGGISSVSSGQTYISQDNKEIDVGKQIKKTADIAIGTALGGGNVGEAVAKNTINQAFDNMGEVGKIAKFVFNLFMDRKSDALQSKATTSQHGSNAMAQLNSTQQKLQDAAFAALSDFTNGDTILSLQECKTALNAAVSQIQDKQEVQNKLTEQKETLIKENEELANKIKEYNVTIKETKDGPEFLDKDGNPVVAKKDENGKNSELTSLINEYSNNITLMTAIDEQIASIVKDNVSISEETKENSKTIKDNQQTVKQEIEISAEEQLQNMRSEISGVYNQFASIIGADEKMHQAFATTDKVLSAAQSAAAIGAAFTNPAKAAELTKKAANNIIASTFDKIGQQLGMKGLGDLATGKVTLTEYATNLATTEFKNQANLLLEQVMPEGFSQTQTEIVNSLVEKSKEGIDPKDLKSQA